jgi:hypothetical protein
MDEMEDSNFTENTQGQSSFIILPSQEESQQESQPDKQMIKIIKNLPALQVSSRYNFLTYFSVTFTN